MPTPPTPIDNRLYLLHVPFDSTYKNVLDFSSMQAQEQYFLSRRIDLRDQYGNDITTTFENCQYIRKNGTIKIPIHIDNLYRCNYVMYKNPYVRDRWIYCFVNGMRYINDNCTELTIRTDVFSTWYNRANLKPSFVEREHTNNDEIGSNTVVEGLETGEFVQTLTYTLGDYLEPYCCIAYTGDNIGGVAIDKFGGIYNGIPSCVPFIVTHNLAFPGLMNIINNAGDGDKIFCAFAIPKLCVYNLVNNGDFSNFFIQIPQNTPQPKVTVLSIDKPASLNGYSPKNKKLLTYPYCYLGFTAPNGSPKIYRFEDFYTSRVEFDGTSEINPNPTIVLTPHCYKNLSENVVESVVINGYPSLSTRGDYFNTWLAQNTQLVNLAVDRANFNYDITNARSTLARDRENTNYMFDTMGNMIGGVANLMSLNLGGLANNIMGGMSAYANHGLNMQDIGINQQANKGNWQYDIKTINAQVEKQSMLPDNATLSSSNATLLGYNRFGESTFTMFSIKPEYAKKIDDYFTMFGYQTNEVKIPNTKGRKYWNYVKTININITGNIPPPDLDELKNIFDTGVTIWHDPTQIYNYNLENEIIGGE